MAPTKKPPFKSRKQNSKKPEEFKARGWLPRGIHVTVYDIQGNAISEDLTKKIHAAVEQIVIDAKIPSLGIDVKKG